MISLGSESGDVSTGMSPAMPGDDLIFTPSAVTTRHHQGRASAIRARNVRRRLLVRLAPGRRICSTGELRHPPDQQR